MNRIPLATEEKLDALRRTELFRELDPVTLSRIATHAVPRSLAKGEVLLPATKSPEGVYVVMEGVLRSVREFYDGREQVLSTERPGDIIAVVSVFDGGVPLASVIAERASIVLFIDKREMHSLCRDHPRLLSNVIQNIASRTRAYAALIEQLSFCDVDSRVARYLLSEARISGRETESGTEFDLSLTQRQIAGRVGSVREVVSRALVRLQRKGLIQIAGHRVLIPDAGALAVAGSEQAAATIN